MVIWRGFGAFDGFVYFLVSRLLYSLFFSSIVRISISSSEVYLRVVVRSWMQEYWPNLTFRLSGGMIQHSDIYLFVLVSCIPFVAPTSRMIYCCFVIIIYNLIQLYIQLIAVITLKLYELRTNTMTISVAYIYCLLFVHSPFSQFLRYVKRYFWKTWRTINKTEISAPLVMSFILKNRT